MNTKESNAIEHIEKELKIKLKRIIDETEYSCLSHIRLNKNKQVIALVLCGCEIGNLTRIISPLRDLKQLTSLDLSETEIKELPILKDLSQLSQLDLSFNKIKDISPIKDLSNITKLDLSDNQVRELSSLKNLNNLNTLYLGGNQIKNISPLKNLSNLAVLHLSYNKINDLSPLKHLNNLIDLSIINNHLNSINILSLKNLSKLIKLDLSSNQITELSCLDNLSNLVTLVLKDNKISDISSLKNLNTLTYLDLSYNEISDISPLKNLNILNSLNLAFNQINALLSLKHLKHLNKLDLSNNPIESLPSWITNFNMEIQWTDKYPDGILFYDNPLKFPPVEIVKKGKIAIRDYFEHAKIKATEQEAAKLKAHQYVEEAIGLFGNLKEDILEEIDIEIEDEKERKRIEYELKKIENALLKVQKFAKSGKQIKTVDVATKRRLVEFVDKISNYDSRIIEALDLVSEGTEKFKEFSDIYNKFAPIFGLPTIPFTVPWLF